MRRGTLHFVLTLVGVALLTTLLPLAAPKPAAAAASGLFFSEYIEGSGNNKALEIYNGTGAPVTLDTASYNIAMYFNGSTTIGRTEFLAGTIANGDVFVIAQSTANASILAQADQLSALTWYTGDDAVVLRRGTTVLDVIGQIGVDPGTEWGSGLTSTADNTLRRKSSVCAGDTNGSDSFDPAAEWDGYATDDSANLGSHIGCAAAVTPDLSVNDVSHAEGNAGSTTYSFTVSLSSPAPAGGVTFDIATADNSATVADNDYVASSLTGQTIPAGQSSYSFDVTVNGDLTFEPDQSFFVNITNVSGANVADGQGVGTLSNDDVGPPATLALNGGDGQTTTVATDFATQLSLSVYDVAHQPVPNATVAFTPPASGASVSVVEAGPYTTDSNGNLSVTLHANTVAGSYQLGVAAGSASTSVNLTNTAGTPASVTLNGGDNQAAVVNTDFATALDLTVADDYGNLVPNRSVTFAPPASGASATVVEAGPYTTDSNGNLSVTLHANTTAGSYQLGVAAGGASTNVNLTNHPGAPASVVVDSGDHQATVVGTDFPTQLGLSVVDMYGNPVPSQAVTFTLPLAGASGSVVEAGPYATDASGNLTVTLHANTGAGTYKLGVAAGNAWTTVSLTNNAGAPATVTLNGGDDQSTVVDTDFAGQLDLTVFDGYGNPVPGANVTFAGPASGASASVVATGPYTTDSTGNLLATVHASTTAGSYEFVASAGNASSTFHLTNLWDGTGQLTASGSSCSSFASGTATTLSQLSYTLSKGKIFKLSEGTVVYWVRVSAPAGNNSFTVNQAVTTGNVSTLLAVGGGSNVFRSDCGGGLKATITQTSTDASSGTISVSFTAPVGGNYYLGLKLTTSGLKGLNPPVPSTVSYTFSTQLVADTTRNLDLLLQ